MRKVMKVNGYLITKFTHKEQYEHHLGPYGVINADYYTGYLMMDRGCFEFDDCGTLIEAMEHAKYL